MKNRILHIILVLPLLMGATATTVYAQTIKGSVYGGGKMSSVVGDASVTINSGRFGNDIFGGGEGMLDGGGNVVRSADTKNTSVTINGGEFMVQGTEPSAPEPFIHHYNIYGGGQYCLQCTRQHTCPRHEGYAVAKL